jgi:uncharacterized protein YxeA
MYVMQDPGTASPTCIMGREVYSKRSQNSQRNKRGCQSYSQKGKKKQKKLTDSENHETLYTKTEYVICNSFAKQW